MHTIEIDDDLYREVEAWARATKQTPQVVIRDALARYTARSPKGGHSVFDRPPTWKSEILQPWTSRAEMLSDFFERDEPDARD